MADDMHGKHCVVTGANSGIGKESAAGLLARGADVTMVCRSPERGEAARRELKGRFPDRDIALEVADLGTQQDIRQLVARLNEDERPIDVLVNNAAVWLDTRTLSKDGIEMTLAVNHLAYYLLTRLLLPKLEAAESARIVNVASEAHRRAKLHLDDLQGLHTYGRMQTYGQSKLCNVLFSRALAKRLKGSSVSVNSLHPGVIATNLGKKTSIFGTFIRLSKVFLKNPKEGAATTLYVATSPDVEGVSGRYFKDCQIARESAAASDDDAAEQLWQMSAALVGMDP